MFVGMSLICCTHTFLYLLASCLFQFLLQGNVIVLDLSQEQFAKNSVLAEILQASGILSDSGSSSESAATSTSEMPAKGIFSSML
jgi:hypothetical protein